MRSLAKFLDSKESPIQILNLKSALETDKPEFLSDLSIPVWASDFIFESIFS